VLIEPYGKGYIAMLSIWEGFVGFLQSVLLTFFGWTGSGGLAIILFTLVARLVILPLTIKSLQSTRKIQELQPQIKEIQRKYGKEPQKLQEETSKLYREYRVNPVGGCLPMLLQLPIFFGVYQAVIYLTQVSVAEYAAGAIIRVLGASGINTATLPQNLEQPQLSGQFLWIENLGQPDPLYILGVLSLIFQLIVQLMAMPRVQDAQQKAMSQSMLILPLMFAYIGFTFPAGAVLYWVVGSLLSMIQQYVISGWGSLANYLKFLPPDRGLFPPAAPVAAAAAGAGPVEVAPKLGFWDVLRPLMEQGSGTTTEPGGTDTPAQQEGESPAPALQAVRRPAGQPVNPRRRKARR
jgi:YidC/Oxa1 family membrane protein insertase